MLHRPLRIAVVAAAVLAAAAAQQAKAPAAYPERDLLTPFRSCDEIVAPPDKAMAQLQILRAIAERKDAKLDYDEQGREVVDDPAWRAARDALLGIGLDAGHLAQILRGSRNADDRDLAFYGAFFCRGTDDIFNLISHIPGEPNPRTRQKAYPRAVAFLRANLGRRWADLSADERQAVLRKLPAPGSPEAQSLGITRAPRDEDHLHQLNLRPFFQLLDRDAPLDQAQALWFLKEAFLVRLDLAAIWCEPALPRIQQLLAADDADVRREAAGLLRSIGPKDLPELAADAGADARLAYFDRATRRLFPPIRQLSAGLVLIQRGPDRDALVAAALQAVGEGSTGESVRGTAKDGTAYRGFRIARVPEALVGLRLPEGAILTAINGTPVADAAQVRRVVANQFTTADAKGQPRTLSSGRIVVDYMLDGTARAIEYRIE